MKKISQLHFSELKDGYKNVMKENEVNWSEKKLNTKKKLS
jgi:hypothetical protein